jgi:hypothetical protein
VAEADAGAKARAEGINRRHDSQLIGNLEVPSDIAKNGDAHVRILFL